MNAWVLEIQPISGVSKFNVLIAVDGRESQYAFSINTVARHSGMDLTIIAGDRQFCEDFRYNQMIAAEVSKLVGLVYGEEPVELPKDVGKFYSAAEALAILESRPGWEGDK